MDDQDDHHSEPTSPETILDPAWVSTYEVIREKLWEELLLVDQWLFYIKRLESFPLRHLYPLWDDRVFLQFAKNALILQSILSLWKLLRDTGGLRHLQSEVFKHTSGSRVDGLRELRTGLRVANRRVQKLGAKLDDIRNKVVAHIDPVEKDDDPIAPISLQELQELFEIARETFDILCLGHHHCTSHYSESSISQEKTDIDRILNLFALISPPVHAPEDVPWWDASELPDEQRTAINVYRRQLGLSEI